MVGGGLIYTVDYENYEKGIRGEVKWIHWI